MAELLLLRRFLSGQSGQTYVRGDMADFCACRSRNRRRIRFPARNCGQRDLRKTPAVATLAKDMPLQQTHRRLQGRCPSGCSRTWIAQKHPANLAFPFTSTLLASVRATFLRPPSPPARLLPLLGADLGRRAKAFESPFLRPHCFIRDGAAIA